MRIGSENNHVVFADGKALGESVTFITAEVIQGYIEDMTDYLWFLYADAAIFRTTLLPPLSGKN